MIAKYGMLYRPPGFSTCPKGFIAFGDHPNFRFGTVDYDRELSDEECYDFQMVRIRPEGERSGVISRFFNTEAKMDNLYTPARMMFEEFQDEFDGWIRRRAEHIKNHTHSQESIDQLAGELRAFVLPALKD